MNQLFVSRGIFSNLSKYTIEYSEILIITDTKIYSIYENILNKYIDECKKINKKINIYQIPDGETSKENNTVNDIINFLLENNYNRKDSCLLAFGGGVVGDLTGYIASIYMRGIKYIQIPTSLLAMVDSSIGGKTGINNFYGKNLIGSFYYPKYILIDTNFLDTLPAIEFINGMAEIIKIAAVANKDLWEFLNKYTYDIIKKDKSLIDCMVKISSICKYKLVQSDFNEDPNNTTSKSRMILNFGHTIGHAIEKMTMMKHGFCVALGMILETSSIFTNCMIIQNKIISCLTKYNLPIDPSIIYKVDQLISYIKNDKKGNVICTITDIECPIILNVSLETIQSVLIKKREIKYEVKKAVEITSPGSKSETNRVLLLAALGSGKCTIHNPLISDDTIHMIDALHSLGIKITINNDKLIVYGSEGNFIPNSSKIYLGNSGTCMRFLIPAICACLSSCNKSEIDEENSIRNQNINARTHPYIILTGNKWMRKRPIIDLINCLNENKAKVNTIYNDCPPIEVYLDSKLNGGEINIDSLISSQYISGLLMATPYALNNTTISIPIDDVPSITFINMTLKIMRKFGVYVHMNSDDNRIYYSITKSVYTNPSEYYIDADASSCIYPLAMSILHQIPLKINNLTNSNIQGDNRYCTDMLNKFECDIIQNNKHTINNPSQIWKSELNQINFNEVKEIDMDSSDTFITYCVIAAFIEQKTIIKNISNQNKKECRRIDATYDALKRCKVDIIRENDNLIIQGKSEYKNDQIIEIECYDDHRMAMSFSILASKIDNIVISNYECVNKTYPSFWKDMNMFGLSCNLYNKINKCIIPKSKLMNKIILIGMPGVGKTTYGREIANKYNYDFADIDYIIEKRTNMTVNEYIKEYGWELFRELEKNILFELIEKENIVISTGGGIIETNECRNILKDQNNVIWIETDLIKIKEDIDKKQIYDESPEELWERRELLYEECYSYRYKVIENNNISQIDNFLNWIHKIITPFSIKMNSTFLSLSYNTYKNIQNLDNECQNIDAIELRADLLEYQDRDNIEKEIFYLHQKTRLPIIFTLRSVREGGKSNINNTDIIQMAIECGCTIVDIELFNTIPLQIERYSNICVIGSCHSDNYDYIIKNVMRGNCIHNPDLIKIISCNQIKDQINKFTNDFEKRYNKKVMNIQRGENGRLSRITNKYMTPVCINNNSKTDCGQITIKELVDIRRILYGDTVRFDKYILYGNPITHSLSPSIHNQYFKEQNRQATYKKIETDSVNEVIKHIKNNNVKGVSITIPLKEEILDHIDILSDDVKEIGALNTITLLEDGKLKGDNTDWIAMYQTIQFYLIDQSNRNSHNNFYGLVIGTGGSAVSACYSLHKLNINFYIQGRNKEKLDILKEKYKCKEYNGIKTKDTIDVIIICVPGEVELDLSQIKNTKLVIDMAYNKEMQRIYNSESKVIDGEYILRKQAKYQNKIWNDNIL